LRIEPNCATKGHSRGGGEIAAANREKMLVTRKTHSSRAVIALAAATLFTAAPAFAQAQPDDEAGLPDDRNSLTIGVGGAYVPSYEGSDDYIATPIGVLFGKVAGISFVTRGTSLAIDIIPDASDAPFAITLGPVVNLRLDRTTRIKDPQVRALGNLDTAIEVGAQAGIAKNGLLHQYDSLGVRLTYQKDVTDTHGSSVLTPAIEYATPLSTKTYVQLGLQAERVGDGFARTYFGVAVRRPRLFAPARRLQAQPDRRGGRRQGPVLRPFRPQLHLLAPGHGGNLRAHQRVETLENMREGNSRVEKRMSGAGLVRRGARYRRAC
jgi:outer membrane scaffolding protein for murein synthesis (MipA/OmpV family)